MRSEKRVLIVEDDEPIRLLLLTVLGRRGQQIDTASNGAEGIARLQHCHYSLVLLDLMMPIVSGYDFLDELERRASKHRPLVIVLTAGPIVRSLNPDVVAGTIRKPFDIELLVDTVEACIAALQDLEQPESCPPAESEAAGDPLERERRDTN
jgi:CheY-like chemotaxis protein